MPAFILQIRGAAYFAYHAGLMLHILGITQPYSMA